MLAAEYLVNKAVNNYIKEVGAEVVQFDAKKGDILIWHAKLMHRGSIPKNDALERPALICHYSPIRDRTDIGREIARHGDGGYFWEFPLLGEVLTEDKLPRGDISGPHRHGRSAAPPDRARNGLWSSAGLWPYSRSTLRRTSRFIWRRAGRIL